MPEVIVADVAFTSAGVVHEPVLVFVSITTFLFGIVIPDNFGVLSFVMKSLSLCPVSSENTTAVTKSVESCRARTNDAFPFESCAPTHFSSEEVIVISARLVYTEPLVMVLTGAVPRIHACEPLLVTCRISSTVIVAVPRGAITTRYLLLPRLNEFTFGGKEEMSVLSVNTFFVVVFPAASA